MPVQEAEHSKRFKEGVAEFIAKVRRRRSGWGRDGSSLAVMYVAVRCVWHCTGVEVAV